MSECVFCAVRDGELPAEILYTDDRVIAIRDLNPQAPLHALVIPRQHIATLNDLRPEHNDLVGHMHLVAARLAAEAGVAEKGYRVLFNCNRQAGQTVFHLHLHVVGGRVMRWPPG
jgi:histidine triad (HIT) family protein